MDQNNYISLQIFNINGELIQTLVEKTFQPGTYSIEWNAEGFPSGVYFVKLVSPSFIKSQKLLLIK